MDDEKDWQDVMIEHKTQNDWTREAINPETSLIYCGRLCDTVIKLEQENKKLNEINKILMGACEFYGDIKHWHYSDTKIEAAIDPPDREQTYRKAWDMFIYVGGKRARQALKQVKELTKKS